MNPVNITPGPRAFSDLVGQGLIVETLRGRLLAGQKLESHLVFAGPRGAGKRTIASLYAQSLVCDARLADGSPCQVCSECLAIQRGSSFAYVEIDAATQGDDETIRTLLDRDALLNTADVRVILINNAERLTIAGADAALKTLERETKSIFLFLVNDLQQFAAAIRSRCHVFRVRPVDERTLTAHLANLCDQNGMAYELSALTAVARESQEMAGRAVSTLTNLAGRGRITVASVRGALALEWGVQVVDCWRSMLADRFVESFDAFQRIAVDGPARILAMQAFLLELVIRDHVVRTSVPTCLALELIADQAWREVTQEWDEFAARRSATGKAMRGEALRWWRGVGLDAPAAVAFQRGYAWLTALGM